MKNLFVRDKKFKNSDNKAYCVQIAINKGFNFLYSIFDLNIKVLDDTHYFGIYFTLFGSFLNFNLSWNRRTDHAGLRFDFDFLWIMINLHIYDTRHWDDEEEKWETYDT